MDRTTSSVFDVTTYLLMYYILSPMFTGGLLFHQLTDPKMIALYIAVFRQVGLWNPCESDPCYPYDKNTKIPFIQTASAQLTLLTFAGIILQHNTIY